MNAAAEFLAALRQGLTRCRIDHVGVLVGVSGGADSVALLRGLCSLQDEFSLSLRVAHLNHKLRGANSDADADWVNALAQTLQVPIEIGSVTNDLTCEKAGLEEAARNARHRFLNEQASKHGLSTIAVAHTADDQTETVLHHIFRGTGLSGLRGIPLERLVDTGQRLVRPMLSIQRDQVEAYLREIAQDFRSDATNVDTNFMRNWLRHELLPQLRDRISEKVDLSIRRLAEQAAEAEEFIATLAEQLLKASTMDAQPNSVRLDVRYFANQPRHLVREAFVRLWQVQGWPRQAMKSEEWNRLAEMGQQSFQAISSACFPGNIMVRRSTSIMLTLIRK